MFRTVALLVLVTLGIVSCDRREAALVTVIDLLRLSGAAERRPVGASFPLTEHACGDRRLASQEAPVPSRIIHRVAFPARSQLQISLAIDGSADASADFRVGISDGRVYETLNVTAVRADTCRRRWTDVVVDLSRYGGPQWSLFYRPDERRWELILGVSPAGGNVTRAWWGRPQVATDSRAARAYAARPR